MQEKAEKELHIAALVPKFFVGIIFSMLPLHKLFIITCIGKIPNTMLRVENNGALAQLFSRSLIEKNCEIFS